MQNILYHLLLLLFPVVIAPLTAQPGILILNGLSHEDRAIQGEKYTKNILVQNASSEVRTVRLYQTDYWFSHTGESHYGEPGTHQRSNASWLTISQLYITLQPDETRTIDFEVMVPEDDALTGTYWSVIMLEGVDDPDMPGRDRGVSIQTVMRYAVQIITHIGDSGLRDLQFMQAAVNHDNGQSRIEVDILNTGERALRPELGIDLFDASGNPVLSARADRRRIYPGTSARIILNAAGVPPGSYPGVIIADCDEEHVFGANVTLEF